jgi:hypothetical protein
MILSRDSDPSCLLVESLGSISWMLECAEAKNLDPVLQSNFDGSTLNQTTQFDLELIFPGF